jgi:phage repressor protein C with HTH and peptisase S24 domain
LPIGWLDHEDDPILPSHGFAPVSVVDSEDPNFIEIRKIKLRLSAGISGFAVDQDEEDGGLRMTFHKSWFVKNGYSPDKLVAVKVRGESMETTLHENDTVVVNTADRTPKDGEVFAVNYEGEAVIKRMVRDIGQWWLSSDNPDQRKYHRKVCQGDACIIIGKVILHQTERI